MQVFHWWSQGQQLRHFARNGSRTYTACNTWDEHVHKDASSEMRLHWNSGCLHCWQRSRLSAAKGLVTRKTFRFVGPPWCFCWAFYSSVTASTLGARVLAIPLSHGSSVESHDRVQGQTGGRSWGAALGLAVLGIAKRAWGQSTATCWNTAAPRYFPSAPLKEEQQGKLSADLAGDSGLVAGCVTVIFAVILKYTFSLAHVFQQAEISFSVGRKISVLVKWFNLKAGWVFYRERNKSVVSSGHCSVTHTLYDTVFLSGSTIAGADECFMDLQSHPLCWIQLKA